jgi:hypothetical protein
MREAVTAQTLLFENRAFAGSAGISRNNRSRSFQPGFHDRDSGQTVISRFTTGMPAPVHVLDGVPPDWVTGRDINGRVKSVKGSVVSGFVRQGRFYTRAETAALVQKTVDREAVPDAGPRGVAPLA